MRTCDMTLCVRRRALRVGEQNYIDRFSWCFVGLTVWFLISIPLHLGASTMTPTKPGWYLARLKSRDYEDREIVKVDNMLHVWQAGYARGWRLDDFNWFG